MRFVLAEIVSGRRMPDDRLLGYGVPLSATTGLKRFIHTGRARHVRIALRDIKTNLKNIPSIAGVGERFILSPSASTSAFIEGNLQVELLKTAAQIDDRETKEEIFRFSFQNQSGGPLSEAKFSLAKVRVVTTGCRVKTKDLFVAMGAIPKDLVSGAKSGYTSTAFNISFECAAGTRAFITFSDMSNPRCLVPDYGGKGFE